MSIKTRLKGFVNGAITGVYALVLAPMAVSYFFQKKSTGSGAGPALATFFGAMAGGIALGVGVLGIIGCVSLQTLTGFPWVISLPLIYFGCWGVVGAIWEMK